MHSGGVASYYDRLGRWNRTARAFGFGGGHTTLTVHRALADPAAGGRATFTRLHDLLLDHVPTNVSLRVLDAGCGLGGTMLMLAQTRQATCVGVTLSDSQAGRANSAAEEMGVAARVRAQVQSYDDPPSGPFDLIVAIESLAHSRNPSVSVAALISVLAPGGTFIVVDDMPEPRARDIADLAIFKSGWQCPVLWSEGEYLAAFASHRLDIAANVDLSPQCRPRTLARITQLSVLNRITRRLAGTRGLGAVMDSHLGGLALERMIRRGEIKYRMLVARKPILQVS